MAALSCYCHGERYTLLGQSKFRRLAGQHRLPDDQQRSLHQVDPRSGAGALLGQFQRNRGSDTFFQRGTTNLPQATLLATLSGNAAGNSFGWYDTTHPTILHTLFSGPAGPGNLGMTFVPSANYGFFIQESNGATFFMQSSLNMTGVNTSGDTSHQHFAIFTNVPSSPFASFRLGVEDSVPGPFNIEGLGDYQDMFVEVTPAPIPEPATLTLLGTGIVGVVGLMRRKSRCR